MVSCFVISCSIAWAGGVDLHHVRRICPSHTTAYILQNLVTNWGDPKKAAQLETNYQNPEVVAQRREILALAAPQAGERVLDVGCGPGFSLVDFAMAVGENGAAYGVDPSDAMCSLALARVSANFLPRDRAAPVTVEVASAEALPYGDESFDIVLMSQVLLYVPDVPLAVAEAKRVLRPGGRIVICDTDWNSLVVNTEDTERFERIRKACCSTFVDAHLPPKLPGLLSKAGLELREMRTVAMKGCGKADRSGGSFIGNWAFRVVREKASAYGLSQNDIKGWLDEQERLSDEEAFFACVHRFLFLAQKPT